MKSGILRKLRQAGLMRGIGIDHSGNPATTQLPEAF